MFRRLLVCVAILLPMAACSTKPPAIPRESDAGETENSDSSPDRTIGFTHVIAAETEYYTTGPQQGRPPDGKFPTRTLVNVVEEAGSYTLVRSEDGGQAYVASDALKKGGNMAMDVSGIVEGGNQFALELYQQLRAGEGNLFLSPSSVSVALAMTYAGADGQTAAEMAETLHFQMPKPELHNGMRSLLSLWKASSKEKGYRLDVANRLWGQESYEFLPTFQQITRTRYGTELARLDFAGKTEEARQTINRWVEDQTENKITDLIPSGALPQDSKLVLTNAVYFKGDWTEPFDKERTKDEDFHVTATEKVKTPLMHQQDDFRYATTDGLQVLELTYGDKSLSMVVLLPEKVDGLPELEAKLTHDNLQRWTSALRSREVDVYLPKFKTTARFELNETLKEMGMPSAFDPQQADFSGMTGGKDLFISKVIHKAFVDVNEEGTVAAAATGIIMAPTAMPVEEAKPVFRADHPFVFMIRDNRNGAILFLGRLTNPKA